MSLQIVSLDRVPEQPWRNGGGVTRELLACPPGPDWQWRLSVAEITQDGPFSAFPGVVRWFAVLEGNGVVLHFADRRVRLDAQTAPLPFDGAAAPHCVLQGGATRDLNLMLRTGHGRGLIQRVQDDDEWLHPAATRAVYTVTPARLQIDDTDAARLPAHSLCLSRHAMRQRWRLLTDEPPRACWIAVDETPGSPRHLPAGARAIGEASG